MLFGLCLGSLLAALLLGQVVELGESVSVGGTTLPGICLLRNHTGVPCPGCGLTRSWLAFAQGEPSSSLHYHRLGWLVMLYVGLQALRHGLWLALPAGRAALERPGRWLDRGLILLAAALLINWILGLSGL